MSRSFDVIVLGAGPAGEVCAGRLAEGGLTVAIVEEHLVGGECSFYACMPSKALLRPDEALAEAQRVPGAAEGAPGPLDAAAALARRDEIVHDLDDSGQVPWLESRDVALVRGHGVLDGEKRVRVGDEVLEAALAVVVATGSDARMPPVDGLAESAPWTNRQATTSRAVPRRLAVLGGGVVGVELAQAWRSLGSEVVLLQGGPRILPREEPFAAEEVQAGLEARGVRVELDAQVERVRRAGGEVTLTVAGGDDVVADELLVGTGRVPRTTGIGVESLDLEAGASLPTDRHLRVHGVPWLYAIGDVNGRALLTHQGKYQGRIAADHLLGRPEASVVHDGPESPRVIFTEPQVAAVGHTLQSAQDAGLDVVAVDADVNETAGGSFIGRGVPGRARLVVDEGRGVVAGATFTGGEVSDLLHAATIAVVAEVPLTRLWHAVPCFPTRTEVWLRLMEAYGMGECGGSSVGIHALAGGGPRA